MIDLRQGDCLDEQYYNIAQERINNAKSLWLDGLLGGDI